MQLEGHRYHLGRGAAICMQKGSFFMCGLVSCTSQHSLYHREVRKCLPGPLKQFYSQLDHHQTLFTIASATEPLLISQSLLSEGGRRDSKDEIIFKKAQKAPIKIAALCDLHHACHRAGRRNLPITTCCNRCGNVSLFLLPLHPCSES